jgi:hypothetical protein
LAEPDRVTSAERLAKSGDFADPDRLASSERVAESGSFAEPDTFACQPMMPTRQRLSRSAAEIHLRLEINSLAGRKHGSQIKGCVLEIGGATSLIEAVLSNVRVLGRRVPTTLIRDQHYSGGASLGCSFHSTSRKGSLSS